MDKKIYTQFGKFSVLVLLPGLLLSAVLLIISGYDDVMMGIVFSFLTLTLLICLLIFYKLTIIIDSTHLTFRLGTGLISRSYLLADIKSCKPVENNPFYGVGIRLMPDGWLFNVSGLHAVELTFKNRKTKIRIGTDQPEVISAEISKMLTADEAETEYYHSYRYDNLIITALVFLVLIFPVAIVLSGRREIKTSITKDEFICKGMYGISVKYNDLVQLDTISVMPGIRRRTNGFAFGRTLKGNFTLDDKTKVKLFITKEAPPYIFIRTGEHKIYLNFRNPGKTMELYNSLKERTKGIVSDGTGG